MQLKHQIYQTIERIWWSKKTPPALLRALTPIYQMCSRSDQKKRLKKAVWPQLPLISIGNITVGGSGKTPFTAWLTKALQQQGFQPVILCRGDGSKNAQVQLVQDLSLASYVGDEALLLHKTTGCPVISSRDRVAACQLAVKYGDIILLDDGLQYRQLKRDCDIVLTPHEGLGNGHLIPAGPLREPASALQRADISVRSGSNTSSPPLSASKEWNWYPSEDIVCDWMQCQQAAPTVAVAITAIARPQRFLNSLQQLNIDILQSHLFPDHHAYRTADLQPLFTTNKAIITTAKDAVKLQELWPKDRPLWVLEQNFEAEKGLIEAILSHLKTGRLASEC
ncbi:MAG: tetraacyldisaccharide 4'-kinase [Mariprofundaceae bacterium]